jgi:predicted AAA+ superfamily ATPase
MNPNLEWPQLKAVIDLLTQPRRSIHVLLGPRWTGKSTLISQEVKTAALKRWTSPHGPLRI